LGYRWPFCSYLWPVTGHSCDFLLFFQSEMCKLSILSGMENQEIALCLWALFAWKAFIGNVTEF
jgi:hypothetical protein